jgi:hypothetical protein
MRSAPLCQKPRRVKPARADLFVAARPEHGAQTPSGVTCGRSPLRLVRQPANRSLLTGFGTIITGAGYHKQATPSGVAGQHAAQRPNACKAHLSSGSLDEKRSRRSQIPSLRGTVN